MADTREAIMARLVALMQTIADVDEVARNAPLFDDEDGKATRITILEGDEVPADDEQSGKRKPPTTPRIIHMHPQILLSNFAATGDVGTGLSAMRAAIIKNIATDSALIALTLDNTGGHYVGMQSDMAFARAMAGEIALQFRFTYVLRPDQL